MFPVSRFLHISAAAALFAAGASAQSVISAKSGLVHYIEGDVSVEGAPVADKAGAFTDIKKGESLTTELGRAEILMTPGVFLRVGEQSSIRMLSTDLADTRVEMCSGLAMLESDTPMKGNAVTVVYKDYATTFPKHGLYEFRTEPAELRVYSGEAQVTAGGQTVTVHEGRALPFTAALAQERFDAKQGDSLYRWSKVRSEYISVANVSAAKYADNKGLQSGYIGNGFGNWAFNNYYGMYTYVPFNGIAYSPFGFAYFSPYTVYQFYQPTGYYNYANGTYASPAATSRVNHSAVVSSSSHSTTAPPARSAAPMPAPASGGLVGGGASHAGGHGK